MFSVLFSLALLFSSAPTEAGAPVEEPISGEEGFIEVVPEKGSPVKKLHDETGAGEEPPTFRLELSGGLLNVDFLPAGPGDWWLGGRLLGGAAPQRHDAGALTRGALSLEVRRYFMLHTEANRFVMGHVLGGAGAEVLRMKDHTLTGPSFSAGAGVGVALSPTLYLGVQYVLTFPVWTGNDTDPKVYASYSTFLFHVTVGF